jgi:U6 snRNA-associated Sm-like protein LSm7
MSRRHYEVFIHARVGDFTTDALADDEGNESSRNLGLIVARGTLLVLISPVDGSEEIENPFQVASED